MIPVWLLIFSAMTMIVTVGMSRVVVVRMPVGTDMRGVAPTRILLIGIAMMMPHDLMQSRVAEQSNDRVRSKRQREEKLAKHSESNVVEGVGLQTSGEPV